MVRSSGFKLVLVAIAALLVMSCATGPRIHAVYEPGLDLSSYKTFSFLQSLEPQGEEYLTLNDRYLREAITRELRARGFVEAPDSDLLVGYRVAAKEKISSTSYPSAAAGYYGYRSRFGYDFGIGYGTETRVKQYTEGTLSIDLVDRERKQLIWEGVAIGRMKEEPPENLKAEIDNVVSAIFAKFPLPGPAAKPD